MPVSSLCLPPSCSERTVHLLCISTLARGSACDETCPGNHLPWEGWGPPAQAASQLPVQRSGTAPALADGPRLLHASPNEQEHCFALLPRGAGRSLPCRTTPSLTCPGRPILFLALYQHPTLLQLLHPGCLQGVSPRSFTLLPAQGWDHRAPAAIGIRRPVSASETVSVGH